MSPTEKAVLQDAADLVLVSQFYRLRAEKDPSDRYTRIYGCVGGEVLPPLASLKSILAHEQIQDKGCICTARRVCQEKICR